MCCSGWISWTQEPRTHVYEPTTDCIVSLVFAQMR